MRINNTFMIESELSAHRLFFNGQQIGTFATLDGAENEATELAERVFPGVELRFELEFGWTLTDLEIRAATLQGEIGQPTQSAIGRGSVCGL